MNESLPRLRKCSNCMLTKFRSCVCGMNENFEQKPVNVGFLYIGILKPE